MKKNKYEIFDAVIIKNYKKELNGVVVRLMDYSVELKGYTFITMSPTKLYTDRYILKPKHIERIATPEEVEASKQYFRNYTPKTISFSSPYEMARYLINRPLFTINGSKLAFELTDNNNPIFYIGDPTLHLNMYWHRYNETFYVSKPYPDYSRYIEIKKNLTNLT